MLTGSMPFEGANPFLIMNARLSGDPVAPRQKNADLSPQVEEIILHAMARNPLERYQTALEMKHDLDQPDQVQVTGRAARLVAPKEWKAGWRGRKLALSIVVIAVVVFGLFEVLKHLHLNWQ
jgi:serine/threonine protein kinase